MAIHSVEEERPKDQSINFSTGLRQTSRMDKTLLNMQRMDLYSSSVFLYIRVACGFERFTLHLGVQQLPRFAAQRTRKQA